MAESIANSSVLAVKAEDGLPSNSRVGKVGDKVHLHRLDYLDVVRGFAALSVVVCHYLAGYQLLARRGLARSPLGVFWDGGAAVSMFFVLSGLVLSLRYFRTPRQPPLGEFSFAAFALSRIFRIQLPFVAALLITALVHRFIFIRIATTPIEGWPYPSSAYWLMRQAILINPVSQIEMPQSWTLGIELVISLLVPAMVLVASESTVWLLGMAAVWAIATPNPGFFGFAVHFALGVALARHRNDLIRYLSPRLVFRLSLFLVGLCLYTINDMFPIGPGEGAGFSRAWSNYLPGIGAALILAFVLTTPPVQKIMSVSWMRHLGRFSYSLYLLHFTVLFIVTPRYLAWTKGLPPKIWWSSGLVFTIIFSMVVSDLFYRFIEVPSVALGKYFAHRMPARPI